MTTVTSQFVRTRSQEWAERACLKVRQRNETLNDNQKKEYASFAKRFPALVHSSGLAQAIAFAQSRGTGQSDKVLEDVASVLLNPGTPDQLGEKARKATVVEYMRLTHEVIQVASWVKRFAEAIFD